ncbi:MAG: hypothetical protein K8H88_10120, partial [Sandaracinaceae bacterium]|nr:hypothetical protein [Sandaracinaceae bacterium]
FVGNATVFALADALVAAEAGRPGPEPSVIPIPAKLVRELLGGAHPEPSSGARAEAGFEIRPRASLHDVARDLERQLFERLFRETRGDFARMARLLLEDTDPSAARKVRLRFNQLGLKARDLRR